MTPKEYLEQARCLDRQIEIKMERIARLKALAERCTAHYSGAPSGGGNPDRRYDVVAQIVDDEQALQEQIDRLRATKAEIQTVIDRVPDERMRMLLEARYLAGMSWTEVAQTLCYDETWIWKLHGRALKWIQIPEIAENCP